MALMKLAAGLAVGYVLGTRAGRERYEQIVASVRDLNNRPSVQQTKEKTARAVRGATSAGEGRPSAGAISPSDEPGSARPSRRGRSTTPPE